MQNIKRLMVTLAVMVFALCGTVYAAEAEHYETDIVKIDGENVEVGVVKSKISTRNSDGMVTFRQSVFIPDFNEITKDEHQKNLVAIQNRINDPFQFYEDNKYIVFNSELNFNNKSYNLEGQILQLVDLISFKVDRTIHSNAPFNSFHDPIATVMQIGPIEGSGWDVLEKIYDQEKVYEVKYGEKYNVPDGWLPVLPGVLDYNVGVRYQIQIDYATEKDYMVDIWHKADY